MNLIEANLNDDARIYCLILAVKSDKIAKIKRFYWKSFSSSTFIKGTSFTNFT
jgi:hypothetical protein